MRAKCHIVGAIGSNPKLALFIFERSNSMKGIQQLERFCHKSLLSLKRGSPTILSCIGSAGVIATTIMAVKATPKALSCIEDEKKYINQKLEDNGWETRIDKLTTIETIKATWRCYIPTALVGLSTIACIFGANALNKRQQAALTSAYILLDNAFKEYKGKVNDLLGNDADTQIQQAMIEDKYSEINILPSGEKQIFYEYNYGEFFERTKEEILQAEFKLNLRFVSKGYATLNDFYELLGLPITQEGEVIGWSTDEGYSMVDFEHEIFTMDDGLECTFINLPISPSIRY